MRFLFPLLFLGLTQCSEYEQNVDLWVFKWSGGTLFSAPNPLSVKEVHLPDESVPEGRVQVVGQVVEVGQYGTHVVISDSSARLLVVLTELEFEDALTELRVDQEIGVMGNVVSGKKGLPYLQALALFPVAH